MRFLKFSATAALAFGLTLSATTSYAQTEFRGTGGANNDVTPGTAKSAFDAFNAAIGATPRRIAWDGVATPKPEPGRPDDVFINANTTGINTTRFLGAGAFYDDTFAVANDGFLSVNETRGPGQFPAFSGGKTFAAFGDGVNNKFTIEQRFVAPGVAGIPATTIGFGAIFMDVELANTSSIEYFNFNQSLGKFFVDVAGDGQFSFLGVVFPAANVSHVQLTLGNKALFNFAGGITTSTGGENIPGGIDLVGTDDFVFANPQAVAPEPGAAVLALFGLAPLGILLRRRK